jgi:DNA-binding LacI/PurR family transcriptional regulator
MKHQLRARHNPGASNASITIKEVAAEAGVSIATVSRVLAGFHSGKESVRNRVVRAVAKLDYHPNHLARGLRLGHRKVIGVIIPDLQNPFFTGVVHGVETALYSAGYTLQLGHSDGLAERERELLNLFRGENIAGVVLMPGDGSGAAYESFRSWDIPVVAIDRSPAGLEVDLVSSNNREGMIQAVHHLLSLGHKEIALLNGPKGINVTKERLDGYHDALRNAGISTPDSFIIHGDFRQKGGYDAMSEFLRMSMPPKAVVVANNLMTLGALQAIHERGVRIPEDLALVCFDDMPWATSLRPPLTAVAQLVEELGRTGGQILLERLKDPSRPVRQVILPMRLMVRASCGARNPVEVQPPAEPPRMSNFKSFESLVCQPQPLA